MFSYFFITVLDKKTNLKKYEQTEKSSAKKWALVATDSVIFGRTQKEDNSFVTLNVYLTNVGYEMLGPDQKAILLPLKEELERRYVAHSLK